MVLLLLVLLGLCGGSFVNAVVWRTREYSKPMGKRAATDKELSILTGRSMCSWCHHTLAWYDLLPVLSWLSLRGKCRYCHQRIDDTPLVEIGTAILFVVSYLYWPQGFNAQGTTLFVFWLLIVVGFVALLVYDLRWLILPDKIVVCLLILAVLMLLSRSMIFAEPWRVAFDALLGILSLAGVFYLLFQLSGGKWIGGGDVKLGVVLGILAGGVAESIMILFIASLVGSLVGIPLLLTNKLRAKSQIPFGPFLILATIIVYLFGSSILNWYKHQFLFL